MIKLSLSGRLFESAKGYVLGRDEFFAFAKATGYQGVEVRYPQLPMETPADEVAKVRRQLADLGLDWEAPPPPPAPPDAHTPIQVLVLNTSDAPPRPRPSQ